MSENNIQNTPLHAMSVTVTQTNESSKRSRSSTSPDSPPESRFVSVLDFSTWKTKLLLLESVVNLKDTTITDLSMKVTQLMKRVEQLENELKDVNEKTKLLDSDVHQQKQQQDILLEQQNNLKQQQETIQQQQQQFQQQPTDQGLASWVSVASRAVARVEGKKVNRTPQQIEVLNSVVSEQRERERRKRNVIVFGVPMSSKTTPEGQDADDKGFIERAFRAIKADVKKIKNIRRFKANPSSNRPAPILIQLYGDGDRSVILKAAKELRKLTEYCEVYINPDMTEAERILDKKRREDRYNLNQQERNNSSNTRYFISGDGFRKFTVEAGCGADTQMQQ
ncbi:unnamed protein product [Brachionus calyciflorus]|uniref:Uncharacterized protein n=1 Tax=Brachionus calyciflorus TaxID=104777 RepID=A0A814KBF8_9BILA|nr:unnamed protein product [Brachionus calyciflorus]